MCYNSDASMIRSVLTLYYQVTTRLRVFGYVSILCSTKFYTRFYTRSDLAFSLWRIHYTRPYTTCVYTMSGTSGKSDIEDVVLDFDFLNNAGFEMLQWTEEIRKLTN